MTNDERRRAFDMRLAGYNWSQIGNALGYTYQAVRNDLFRVMDKAYPLIAQCPYPKLAHYICGHCGGSVKRFIREAKLPEVRAYKAIYGQREMERDILDAIAEATGLLRSEVLEEETATNV